VTKYSKKSKKKLFKENKKFKKIKIENFQKKNPMLTAFKKPTPTAIWPSPTSTYTDEATPIAKTPPSA
jgi:hypothetical protein